MNVTILLQEQGQHQDNSVRPYSTVLGIVELMEVG